MKRLPRSLARRATYFTDCLEVRPEPNANTMNANTTNTRYTPCCSLLLLLGVAALSGCYDEKRLVEEVRKKAIRSRLEEVDLGSFRTTLPRDILTAARIEVELELFGTEVRYKIPEIKKGVDEQGHRLRQAVLVAIRQMTPEEMDDPGLGELRQRLLHVVNSELSETPVKELGIRKVRFIPL